MLNNRQISEIFEVQLNTLYNWQKSKPKLLKYLKNADYNNNRNHEINILLDEYSQNIIGKFTITEIEYILKTSLKLVSIEDIKQFETLFIQQEAKHIPTNTTTIMNIYDTLKLMNIIDKYIFYKKIYKFQEDSQLESKDIKTYFSQFLNI